MINKTETPYFPIDKLLNILEKQNNSFKLQISSFIDITYFSITKSEYINNLKMNMNEIYILTCKISKFLEESLYITNNYFDEDFFLKKKLKKLWEKNSKNKYEKKNKTDFIENEVRKNFIRNNILKTQKKNHSDEELFLKNNKNCLTKKNFLKKKCKSLESVENKKNYSKSYENIIFEDSGLSDVNNIFNKKSHENFQNENLLIRKNNIDNKSSLFDDKFLNLNINEDFLNYKKQSEFLKNPQFSNYKKSEEILKIEEILKYPKIKKDLNSYNSIFSKFKNPKKKKKIKKRGQYNIIPKSSKLEAIRIARIKSPKTASRILNISEKNIKRWLIKGVERKKGAGRKTMDPEMEKKLLVWIKNYFLENKRMPGFFEIRGRAVILSNFQKFKASKGWYDKFFVRNKGFFENLEI